MQIVDGDPRVRAIRCRIGPEVETVQDGQVLYMDEGDMFADLDPYKGPECPREQGFNVKSYLGCLSCIDSRIIWVDGPVVRLTNGRQQIL